MTVVLRNQQQQQPQPQVQPTSGQQNQFMTVQSSFLQAGTAVTEIPTTGITKNPAVTSIGGIVSGVISSFTGSKTVTSDNFIQSLIPNTSSLFLKANALNDVSNINSLLSYVSSISSNAQGFIGANLPSNLNSLNNAFNFDMVQVMWSKQAKNWDGSLVTSGGMPYLGGNAMWAILDNWQSIRELWNGWNPSPIWAQSQSSSGQQQFAFTSIASPNPIKILVELFSNPTNIINKLLSLTNINNMFTEMFAEVSSLFAPLIPSQMSNIWKQSPFNIVTNAVPTCTVSSSTGTTVAPSTGQPGYGVGINLQMSTFSVLTNPVDMLTKMISKPAEVIDPLLSVASPSLVLGKFLGWSGCDIRNAISCIQGASKLITSIPQQIFKDISNAASYTMVDMRNTLTQITTAFRDMTNSVYVPDLRILLSFENQDWVTSFAQVLLSRLSTPIIGIVDFVARAFNRLINVMSGMVNTLSGGVVDINQLLPTTAGGVHPIIMPIPSIRWVHTTTGFKNAYGQQITQDEHMNVAIYYTSLGSTGETYGYTALQSAANKAAIAPCGTIFGQFSTLSNLMQKIPTNI